MGIDLAVVIPQVEVAPSLELEGVFTHFARADEPDLEPSLEQVERFRGVLRELPMKIRKAAGVDAAEAELAVAKTELQQPESRSAEHTLASSAYGKIQRFGTQPGETVSRGKEVTRIVDDEQRFLSVAVPGEKLAKFERGNTMLLRFPYPSPRAEFS